MKPDGNAPAVLFDVDGTLVDSNYLHVDAWYRAFAEVGLGRRRPKMSCKSCATCWRAMTWCRP